MLKTMDTSVDYILSTIQFFEDRVNKLEELEEEDVEDKTRVIVSDSEEEDSLEEDYSDEEDYSKESSSDEEDYSDEEEYEYLVEESEEDEIYWSKYDYKKNKKRRLHDAKVQLKTVKNYLKDPLVWAIKTWNNKLAKKMITESNIDHRDDDGDTLLMIALSKLNYVLVHFIIDNFDPDVTLHNRNMSPLTILLKNDYIDVDVLKKLVLKGALDGFLGNIYDILLKCIKKNYQEVFSIIINDVISKGNSFNINKFVDDYTLLMWATKKHTYHIAKELLKRGSDPNVCSNKGFTCISYASNQPKFIQLFMDYGANPNVCVCDEKGGDFLIISICRKYMSFKVMKKIITPENVNLKSKNGNSTCLEICANKIMEGRRHVGRTVARHRINATRTFSLLIEAGAIADYRNENVMKIIKNFLPERWSSKYYHIYKPKHKKQILSLLMVNEIWSLQLPYDIIEIIVNKII